MSDLNLRMKRRRIIVGSYFHVTHESAIVGMREGRGEQCGWGNMYTWPLSQ